ncbi:transcription factor bHLH95-like [Lycium ferocissimum]|uniref:transcription factor bHLH95-like n=1 Tax=Lycium ferocissimum TaxID=112874 RepID=UPI002815458E|nr:transcription factor bHLH95-like [Lycium ferocissimum]
MNEGSDNDFFMWENNQGWPSLNSNNLVGSGEKFAGDKLPDPNRFDTCQPPTAAKETAEATASRKRSASSRVKDGKKSGEAKSGDGGGEGGGDSDHEIHIWTERERRKKMRNMFSNLHALLPQLPPKADKSTIVDEAVNYIKTLQNTLEKLQKQKLERLHPVSSAMNFYDPSIITSQKLLSVGSSREQFLADQGSTSNSAAITPTNNKTASPLLMNNIPATFQTWSSPHVVLTVCGEEAHISVCCPKKVGLFSAICCVLENHKIEIVSAQVSSDHYRSMFMIQAHARGGSSFNQFSQARTVEEIYQQAAAEIMFWTTPQ